MAVNNKTGWKTEFTVAISTLEGRTRLSKSSIIRARNQLKQVGRIDFKERKGNQSCIYLITAFHTDTQSVTQTVTQTDTQTVTQTDTITKLNKTKLNKTSLLEKESKRKISFSPPSLEEIQNYILEKDFKTVNAESFLNFYASKNWYVGKNKMKSWQMALSGWESRNKEKTNQNQNANGKQAPNTKQAYEFSVDRVIETYAGNS
jgi:hypothetical protein